MTADAPDGMSVVGLLVWELSTFGDSLSDLAHGLFYLSFSPDQLGGITARARAGQAANANALEVGARASACAQRSADFLSSDKLCNQART